MGLLKLLLSEARQMHITPALLERWFVPTAAVTERSMQGIWSVS